MSDAARKWLEWYDEQQSKVDINLSCKIPSKHIRRLLKLNENIEAQNDECEKNYVELSKQKKQLESDNAALKADNARLQKQVVQALPYVRQLRDSMIKGDLIVSVYLRLMIENAYEALKEQEAQDETRNAY